MAAETLQQKENSGNFFKDIADKLKELFDSIGNKFKEIFGVTSQTKADLKNLEEEILKVNDDKLRDNEVEQGVEGSLNDEKTILGKLVKNNQDIKNWMGWIKDIAEEDLVSGEIENILSLVKEKANNDNDNTKGDLTEDELKEIGTKIKNKITLCDGVLKSDKIKDLPDDKKTKKAILEAYNKALADNNGDASKVTEDLIINNLKGEQPES